MRSCTGPAKNAHSRTESGSRRRSSKQRSRGWFASAGLSPAPAWLASDRARLHVQRRAQDPTRALRGRNRCRAPWRPSAEQSAPAMWLSGLGFGMFFSPNARQVVGAAPHARAAAAGALFSTTRGAGQTFGATAIAALLALGLGIGPAPGLIAAGLTFIAGLCSVAVLRRT
jgi:hypothetical protein